MRPKWCNTHELSYQTICILCTSAARTAQRLPDPYAEIRTRLDAVEASLSAVKNRLDKLELGGRS
jgi:hypothetical protein